ncbi:hypothetical protein [Bradyrhizobium monzae]|uniref:hypothetical protein n=1 Tax=Bradyrhizobium sp. Oc8 TaxID=2876780 RepID=UPI001F35C963|nr:hypothetical protein [Bradyrhizobium sp. Oc8]
MRWQSVKTSLAKHSIELPDTPSSDGNFCGMMHCLLSAMHGEPVGWKFLTLGEVAHRVAQHLLTLDISGHEASIGRTPPESESGCARKVAHE